MGGARRLQRIFEELNDSRGVLGGHDRREGFAFQIGPGKAQQPFYPRVHVGETACGIKREDEIGRAFDKVTVKSLGLLQALAHFTIAALKPGLEQGVVDGAVQLTQAVGFADEIVRSTAERSNRCVDRVFATQHDDQFAALVFR